ncbi:hypothetical protein RCF19_33900 [Rhodococcus qingshengii]
MTDKDLGDLGVAAGDIISEAFHLGYETCRNQLIPAGGMALTSEQVEDVEALVWLDGRRNFDAFHRLRALFPATEPAEDAPCMICNVNETNHAGVSYYHPFTTELGPFDDDGNDRPAAAEPAAAVRDGSDLVVVQRSHTAKAVQSWMTLDLWTDLGKNDKDFDAEYERQGFGDLWATLLGEVRTLVQATTPAPAEPAEEETKAEGPCEYCNRPEPSCHAWRCAGRKAAFERSTASLPVVPAPTETEAGHA